MKFSEVSSEEYPCGIIYGPSRSGKTFLCGSAGNRAGWIIVGAPGIATLKSPLFKSLYPNFNPDIEFVTEELIPDKPTGYNQVCDYVEKYLSNPSIDIIIIDDLTQFKRISTTEALYANQTLGVSRSLAESKKIKSLAIAVQDYKQEMSFTNQFFARYISESKSCKKSLILTAHERKFFRKAEKLGGEDTVLRTTPGFTGKTNPDEVSGLFDFIWYLERVNNKYFAKTEGSSSLQAGTRYAGIFPERWESPNLLKALEAIKKGVPIKNASQ